MASAALMASVGKGLAFAGIATQTLGAYRQAKQEKAVTQYNADVSRRNAEYVQEQAQDAVRRGQEQESQVRSRAALEKGSQRASMAARGLDLSEGSALNILADTDYFGELDALTVRENTSKEVKGRTREASNLRRDAQFQSNVAGSISPASRGFSTLITGAGQVASSWYRK